jgi:hypothetical protein
VGVAWHLFLSVTAMLPVRTSMYIAAVWSFMTAKWGLSLFLYCRMYVRILVGHDPPLISTWQRFLLPFCWSVQHASVPGSIVYRVVSLVVLSCCCSGHLLFLRAVRAKLRKTPILGRMLFVYGTVGPLCTVQYIDTRSTWRQFQQLK